MVAAAARPSVAMPAGTSPRRQLVVARVTRRSRRRWAYGRCRGRGAQPPRVHTHTHTPLAVAAAPTLLSLTPPPRNSDGGIRDPGGRGRPAPSARRHRREATGTRMVGALGPRTLGGRGAPRPGTDVRWVPRWGGGGFPLPSSAPPPPPSNHTNHTAWRCRPTRGDVGACGVYEEDGCNTTRLAWLPDAVAHTPTRFAVSPVRILSSTICRSP